MVKASQVSPLPERWCSPFPERSQTPSVSKVSFTLFALLSLDPPWTDTSTGRYPKESGQVQAACEASGSRSRGRISFWKFFFWSHPGVLGLFSTILLHREKHTYILYSKLKLVQREEQHKPVRTAFVTSTTALSCTSQPRSLSFPVRRKVHVLKLY